MTRKDSTKYNELPSTKKSTSYSSEALLPKLPLSKDINENFMCILYMQLSCTLFTSMSASGDLMGIS